MLGVWGLIAVIAFLAVFATNLPDTSTLYNVQQQPSISYLDRSRRPGGWCAAARPRRR